MRRAFAITVRTLLSALGVAGASVISAPVWSLSHEEWVMAFVRFVEWPTPLTDGALQICQADEGNALDLEGRQVRGLTLHVRRVAQPREADGCHLIAVLSAQESAWQPWLGWSAQGRQRAVLTIGAGARFCEFGGGICLLRDEATRSEKFQLNLDTLSRNGFKVSTQLLRAQPQRPGRGD